VIELGIADRPRDLYGGKGRSIFVALIVWMSAMAARRRAVVR
jgi:hypothetical protein